MKHWVAKGWAIRGATSMAVVSLSLMTGCAGFFVYPGSIGSSSSTSNVVYVANSADSTIGGFAIGTNQLTAVTGSPYSLKFTPTALAVTPADTFLYVGSSSLIYCYSIAANGALTAANNGSAVAIADVVSMDISPDGQWLFALDGNGVTIDQYQINSTTGLPSSAAGASYKITGATVVPRAVKVSPNGDYVFVALGTAGDLVYSFSTTTGLLTSSQQLAPVSTTTSDNALAVSPTSSTLYIARSGTSGGLAAYSIGNNGALTSVSGSPFAAGTQPYSVVVNNAGTDVYVANRGDGTISGYGVASSGTLTALTGSPYTSGPAVTALAADKTGDYLLAAANGGAPDLTLYSFDSVVSGKLDLTTTAATGTDPTGPVAIALTH